MSSDGRRFDAIVIGSGIGGLAAAASLAKCGRRVLVLEQHLQLGGLTQAFTRQDYTFATGVHYIGGVGEAPGPDNQFGRLLRWLTDGRLRFASTGSPYDIVRLPGFEFPVEAPRDAYVARLTRSRASTGISEPAKTRSARASRCSRRGHFPRHWPQSCAGQTHDACGAHLALRAPMRCAISAIHASRRC
jgi:phytoene dehydrogenase-like protein